MGDLIDLREGTTEAEVDETGQTLEIDEAVEVDETARTAEPEPVPLGAPSVSAGLEALLLLADEPLPGRELAEILGRPEAEVEQVLTELALRYLAEDRGIELRRVDTGWRFYTAASCQGLITRYVTDGRQSRLSAAALETLAIVAYRQPVTRSQVGAVRGVNPDGVLKTLQARGLITEAPQESGVTHFVTTGYFLDRMGLDSLTELPPIADHLPDLASLDELID